MQSVIELDLEKKFKKLSLVFSCFISLVGFFVLLGWLLDISFLKSIFPHWSSMKVNTAVCFALAGIILFLLNTGQKTASANKKRIIPNILALIILFIGTVTLLQYIFDFNAGIDELLFWGDKNAIGTTFPSRMSPSTAFCFMLFGFSFLLQEKKILHHYIFQFFPLIAGVFSFIAITVYLFDTKMMYGIMDFSGMAFHTACCFLLLTFATLFSQPEKGFMRLITSDSSGGKFFRMLFPNTTFIIITSSWLYFIGEEKGLFDAHYSATFLVLTLIIVISFIFWLYSYSLTKSEKAFQESEQMYRSLFENMLNGFAYCQMHYDDNNKPYDFTYLSVNTAFEAQTGLKNVIGKKVTEVIPTIKKSDSELFEIYGRVSKTGNPERFEFFVNSLNMWFWISVYSLEHGYFVTVFDVITERKKAEELLQKSEEKYRAIFESTGTATLLVEADTTIAMANKECYIVTGYAPIDLVGKKWIQFVAPESLQEMIKNHRLRREQPDLAPKKYEAKLINKKGEVRNVILDIGMIPGSSQSIVSILDITERKNAEKEVHIREAYLSAIIENQPGLVWLKDTESKFLIVNNAFAISCGKQAPMDIQGKTDLDIWPRELAEKYRADDIQVIQNDNPISVEELIQDKGEVKWFETFKTLVKDKDGKVIGTTGFSRDITERKQAEEKIKHSEVKLREAQQVAKIGNWETDLLTMHVTWSEEIYRIFELNEKEFFPTHSSFLSFIHPEDKEKVDAVFVGSFEKDILNTIEHRIITSLGNQKIVEERWQIIHNEGKPVRAVGTCQDITERKQIEAELHKSEQNFRNFIDNSPLAIYFFDAKTRSVLFANPAFYQLLGYTEADALTIYDFVHHSGEDIDKILHNITKGVKLTIGEREWKAKNGTIYKMFVNASYISSEYERIIYVTAQDITALKITQQENEALIKELLNKYNELMQFNYIVSHNLRAPIASILGLASIITLPETTEEEKLKTFEYILQSISKMEELTQDLNLILSTRSAINTQRENITITDLLQSITDTLERQIKEAKCDIKTNVAEDAKAFFTVKSYFESILYNLISNAIKYRAVNRPLQIIVSTKKENNTIIISVSDNGIGIDIEKYNKQLFGLYKRFHLSVEGKGLGLHMTKAQVETLGGKITVESKVDKGTIFIITLPV